MTGGESPFDDAREPWFVQDPLPPLDRIRPAHTGYVRSLLNRFRVKPAHWREDLAQEILLRAHRSRRSPLAVRALLYGISRHVVLKWRAKRKAESEVLSLLDEKTLVTEHTAEDDWQERKWREVVSAAVAELSSIHREVFVLTQMEGRTMPEVARQLGIPVNTGYTRLRAAQESFQKALERALARRSVRRGELL